MRIIIIKHMHRMTSIFAQAGLRSALSTERQSGSSAAAMYASEIVLTHKCSQCVCTCRPGDTVERSALFLSLSANMFDYKDGVQRYFYRRSQMSKVWITKTDCFYGVL